MSNPHTNLSRLAALTAAITALAGPGVATAGDDPTLRNDRAHFGPAARQTTNPVLRNDKAHFPPRRIPTSTDSPAAVVVRVDGGFDWAAAGVGAAGGSGLLLVLGVAAVALRRRQHIDAAQA